MDTIKRFTKKKFTKNGHHKKLTKKKIHENMDTINRLTKKKKFTKI